MTDQNNNLVVRLTTAFLLLPLVIWLIYLGGIWFTLLISVAAALAALELNLLPGAQPVPPPALPVGEPASRKERQKARASADEPSATLGGGLSGAAIASVGAAFVIPFLDDVSAPVLSIKALLAALVIVSFADALLFEHDLTRAPGKVGLAVLGAVYPGLLLSALVRLRQFDNGAWWVVLALVVTWWNDSGAYFAGRAFGKRKLSPRISPSKTWEGALGGTLAATFGSLLLQHFFIHALPIWGAVLIGLGASVMGPLGDLSESMLKRAFGAKDSGKLLPGHGGLLDRIDALLFNAPFVLLCARLFATSP